MLAPSTRSPRSSSPSSSLMETSLTLCQVHFSYLCTFCWSIFSASSSFLCSFNFYSFFCIFFPIDVPGSNEIHMLLWVWHNWGLTYFKKMTYNFNLKHMIRSLILRLFCMKKFIIKGQLFKLISRISLSLLVLD